MLAIQTIRDESLSSAYQKGRDLFVRNLLLDVTIEPDADDENMVIEGKVKGSGRKWYQVSLTIDEEDEILDSWCQCPAYENYWGMCKHCVALALYYRSRQNTAEQNRKDSSKRLENYLSSGVVKKGAKKETSREIRDMIAAYALQTKMQLPGEYDHQVELIPEFHSLGKNMTVEFKIGAERKYVLKNMCQFLDCVENRKEFEYGKKLRFVHDKHVFTEEAWHWKDFISDLLHNRYQGLMSSGYQYSSGFREIALGAYGIEKCFQYYMGKEMVVDGKPWSVKDEDPRLPLILEEQPDGGAVVKTASLEAIYGSTRKYLLNGNTIYQCSSEFVQNVWPALVALQAICPGNISYWMSKTMYLNKEDFRAFFGSVLPMLEPYMTISSGKIDIDSYRPEKPEFQVYLELDENHDHMVMARANVVYGENLYDLFQSPNLEKEYRNLELEGLLMGELEKYFSFSEEKGRYTGRCDKEDVLYHLLKEGLSNLGEMAEVFVDEKIRAMRVIRAPRVNIGVGIGKGLLNLSIQSDEMSLEEMDEILSACRMKRKFFRMKNGDFIGLEENGLSLMSELSSGLQISPKEWKNGEISVPEYRATYVSETLKQASEGVYVDRSSEVKRLVREMKSYSDSDFQIPKGLQAKLRNYQEDGFRWLATLDAWGFGGILADDMGLGKTIQVIAFLLMKKEKTLIVCPASLVYNWENEIVRFAPELNAQVISGNQEERKKQLDESQADILITSYDLLKKDIEWYQEKEFFCVIADEAQYIKNAGTLAAKTLKAVRAVRHFALTGTPIENKLSDLWSIFDFVMPGYLYGYEKFRKELELPVVSKGDEEALKRLQRMIAPFILRRKKADVLKDLPEKIQEIVYTRMESEQKKLYDAHVKRLQMELSGQTEEDYNQNRLKYLAELTKLRMICCAPFLCFDDYKGGSAKTDMCLELIENSILGGHRLLIFSQFTKMLDILAKELEKKKLSYLYLSGKDSKEQRKHMVERFSKEDIPVFLISLKAGGTGLNLTAADMVIHYDPWWNQAAKDQATDRTHRIGQKQVVTVMDLVVKDSIEEKIVEMQKRKSEMADEVMDGNMISNHRISKEELLELLNQ